MPARSRMTVRGVVVAAEAFDRQAGEQTDPNTVATGSSSSGRSRVVSSALCRSMGGFAGFTGVCGIGRCPVTAPPLTGRRDPGKSSGA
ncbi:hypothetical protein AB0B56_28035 [Streptosporangium canum]|uniref:hypothetical protein n=1 Tax=Streptosporangium canum TaxID=324952 RepID=UPI00343C20DA